MKYRKDFLKASFAVFCLLFLILTSNIKADQLMDVSFSADGTKILSRHRDKISVWETHTGKLLRTFESGTNAFKYAAFLPDGKTVFSVNGKAEMIWLDIETGELKNKGKGKAVAPFAISPDRKTIVYASVLKDDKELINFHDSKNGKSIENFIFPQELFTCLSFFPNNEKLVMVSSTKIIVISVKDGRIEKTIPTTIACLSCAVSPDGNSVLLSNLPGTDAVRILSLQNNEIHQSLEKKYTSFVRWSSAVGYSPIDPDLAFVAGTNQQTDYKFGKGLLLIWNTKTGNIIQSFNAFYPLASAAFSPDGKSILAQEANGCPTLFDVKTGAVIRKYPDQAKMLDDSTSKRLYKAN